MPDVIKLGTRKSKLALWQAEFVARKLRECGQACELVTMETKGDKILDVSISKIGSKGVFTEELEEKLASGEIDAAIHSAKDMQSQLPEGFEIIAFTEREITSDVIVSDSKIDLNSKDLVLGTSSTRRIAFFSRYFPEVTLVDMRGNLQTRLEKMRKGACDGLVLAYAGVHRMGYNDLIQMHLDDHGFIPAVGQGSVAVETHVNLDPDKKEAIRKIINHSPTEALLLAERKYLSEMNGGCSIPIFGLATSDKKSITLTGGIISLDGKEEIRKTVSGTNPDTIGSELAKIVISLGGDRILAEIKSQL
jgi:hydroxymethylbilane synthase